MKFMILFSVLFIFPVSVFADFIIFMGPSEDQKINVSAQEAIYNGDMPDRVTRDSEQEYIYPPYKYSSNVDFIERSDGTLHDWSDMGYTILKEKPSNPQEAEKVKTIQQDIQNTIGKESYDIILGFLKDYSLIDVRYYSILNEENSNKACVSVFWKKKGLFIIPGNGTVNFCGQQTLSQDSIELKITEWSTNDKDPISLMISEEDAMNLFKAAMVSLITVYSIPENREALFESIEKP